MPQAFAAKLGRAIFTNGKSDCELVAGLYADTLAGSFGKVDYLSFRFARWTDTEAVQLAEMLPHAKQITGIDLRGNNRIGKRGLDAINSAIANGGAPKLEWFVFSDRWEEEPAYSLYNMLIAKGIYCVAKSQ